MRKNLRHNYVYLFKTMWEFGKFYVVWNFVTTIINGLYPLNSLIWPKLIMDELTEAKRWNYVAKYILILIFIEILFTIFMNILKARYLKLKDDLFRNYFALGIRKKWLSLT